MSPRIGIVAGAGELPERVIATCREQGLEPFVIALRGHADPDAFSRPPDAWIRLGEGGRGLDLLRAAQAREIVLVGAVKRPSLASLRPDARTAKFIAQIGRSFFRDGSILGALAKMLEDEGFAVIAPETLAGALLVEPRLYGPLVPDEDAQADIERGVEVARALGRLEVGQGVIVQDGAVIGVEAAEGTDALIARCAGLIHDGPGGVLVKVCKPGQDRRLDLPTIGVRTVRGAAGAGLRGIALEAGAALIVDAQAVARAAAEAGLFVIGIEPSDQG